MFSTLTCSICMQQITCTDIIICVHNFIHLINVILYQQTQINKNNIKVISYTKSRYASFSKLKSTHLVHELDPSNVTHLYGGSWVHYVFLKDLCPCLQKNFEAKLRSPAEW